MIRRTRYLCGLGSSLGALLMTVVAFNLLIDPYGYFGAPRIPGLNALKPEPGAELPAVKRNALARVAANALILGNSRAEVGFDPKHPAWGRRGLDAYNAAVRGSELDSAARMLETARRHRDPSVIVLGLDFVEFLTDPAAEIPRFPTARAETLGLRMQRWIGALATIRGLRDSFRTILAQHERYPQILTDRGFNPLLEYQGIARVEGYYAMFRQRAQENARICVRKPAGIFVSETQTSPTLEIVKGLVHQARRGDTELHLVIYPYHAQMLITFEAAGLWPAFEAWKRRLTEIAAEGGKAVSLWDFSGFSAYSTEVIPGPGDTTTEVRWYWEAGHFKKALGDLVLERILLPGDTADAGNFGVRLTGANIDAHLRRISQDRDAFRTSNQAFVADTEALVERAR